MKRFFTFLLIAVIDLTLVSRGATAATVTSENGVVESEVNVRAGIPNQEGDYQLFLTSVPKEEVAPDQEIIYTILFGCDGGNGTPELDLFVSWNFPEGVVAEYVPGSASSAYDGALPKESLTAGQISWEMKHFPARTTSRKVSFKLKTKSQFASAGTFPIEIRARLVASPYTKEVASLLRVTYLKEGLPGIPTTWRFLVELFASPLLKYIIQRLVLLILILIAILSPLIFLARFDISLSSLPVLLLYGFRWVLALLGKKRPVWGKIFEASTHRAIFLAKVTVYDFKGHRLEVGFTTRQGAFGFSLPQRKYLLEIEKSYLPFGRGGFSLSSASSQGLLLSDKLLVWDCSREEGEICLLKRSLLGSFWEETCERVFLEISDFVLILGTLLGLANLYFHPSSASALVLFSYLLLLSLWTISIFR